MSMRVREAGCDPRDFEWLTVGGSRGLADGLTHKASGYHFDIEPASLIPMACE